MAVNEPKGSLTRLGLADALHEKGGVPRKDAAVLVDAILEHVMKALANGEKVLITGFGTFVLRDKPARMGRNPRNGEAHIVTARRVVSFYASDHVRRKVAPSLKVALPRK